MCGIACHIGRDRDQVRQTVTRMSDALAHRGPDADGVEVHPFGAWWIGLAQRRLAIIDLSPLGRQPMAHAPSGSRIVFNGEIYNFQRLRAELEREGERFVSVSDTETILAGVARWGPAFVKRLQGMYAFAHYDPRRTSLTIARDPAGIKPLYFAEADGELFFASEVRAIVGTGRVRRTISKAAVAGMLAYGSVPQPLSIFERILMMSPGSWQTIEPTADGLRRATPTVWWTPPKPEKVSDDRDIIAETRTHLDDSIRDHLIADVPVGVFLSAGLDSSIIAGLTARFNPNIRTFTVGFGDNPDLDEISVAAETARRFGLSHEPIRIPAEEAEASAAGWFASADQPSMDGLNTYVISQAVRKRGIKVALCGLGGDELFGGYTTFRDVPRALKFAQMIDWLPSVVRRGFARLATLHKPEVFRAKFAEMLGGPATVSRFTLQRRRFHSTAQLQSMGLIPEASGVTNDWLPPEAIVPSDDTDPIWTIAAIEAGRYMTDMLLRDSDANGLAHALEIRVPFLDQRLMDFAHRLPGETRLPPQKPGKWLLREAARDVLHDDLLSRPKTGFTLPLNRWMTGPLKVNCESGLNALKQSGLVNPLGVDAIWQSFLSDPESAFWTRALVLVTLGDYVRRQTA